jgi:hypothetical protein
MSCRSPIERAMAIDPGHHQFVALAGERNQLLKLGAALAMGGRCLLVWKA